ncbi:MAG: hypothetical protein ACTSPM_09575 [Candidatus Heimdallarchaeota archaeon]
MAAEKINFQTLKPKDLTIQEIKWLIKLMELAFRNNVERRDIVFAKQNKTHVTFYRIPHGVLDDLGNQSIPKRFLQKEFITLGIPGQEREEEYFARIELIYWYFKHIKDIFDYKDILERFFGRVIYGDRSKYNKRAKGYWILRMHLEEEVGRWSAIRKTFLFGFAIYLKLIQESSILTLSRIYDAVKNKSLNRLGITEASDEQYGMSSHYSKLGLCWHCGFIEVSEGGLCRECSEYWDKRTK